MNESQIANKIASSYKAGEDWQVSSQVLMLVSKVADEIKRRGGTLGFIVDNKILVKNFVLDKEHGVPLDIRLYEGTYHPGKVVINAYFSGLHPIPVKDRIPFDAKMVVDAVAKGFMSLVNYRKMARVAGMRYPTMQQVEHASLFQLVNWGRYLPSPGENFIEQDNFREMLEKEAKIMDRIIQRRDEIGITPEVSKAVGWERRSDDKGLRPDSADATIGIGLNEAMDELDYKAKKTWTAASEILKVAKDLLSNQKTEDIFNQIRDRLRRSGKVVTEDQMMRMMQFKGPSQFFTSIWKELVKEEYLIKVPGGYKWNDEGLFSEQ